MLFCLDLGAHNRCDYSLFCLSLCHVDAVYFSTRLIQTSADYVHGCVGWWSRDLHSFPIKKGGHLPQAKLNI